MRRSRIESTTLRSVGYDAKAGILELEFCSGAVYQYLGVPTTVHQGLLSAASKGKYFHLHIRERYQFRQMSAMSKGAV
jgi:KTSC domain-containing protein